MTLRGVARRIGIVGRSLDVAVPRQTTKRWCWAACASAISTFYDADSNWTQCAVANATLDRTDCCNSASACSQLSKVRIALAITGNLASREQALGQRALRAELGRGHPIVARIQFPKTGHFVVIDGYSASGLVHVRDPGDGRMLKMNLDKLLYRYNDFGLWTHSYRTRA
jgi:hypothetical protein